MSAEEKRPMYFDEMYPDELRQTFNDSVTELGVDTALRQDHESDANMAIRCAHDQALTAQELGNVEEEIAWLGVHQELETRRINYLASK